MQHFGRRMCKQQTFNCVEMPCWTMAFLSSRSSNFFFFPLKCYLLTFYPLILSAVFAVQKGFLHLHIYPPHNFLRSLWTFLYESGLQGWHAKQMEAAVIFPGWSIVFLLVDIFKALPQIHNFKNLTPFPIPQICHFFLLCSRRILLLAISLCALVPWSRGRF